MCVSVGWLGEDDLGWAEYTVFHKTNKFIVLEIA